MPEISVIVPVYKAEAYINRCVDSILSQTFTDFELILVDDGSPDRSGAICDEYAQRDSRVRVIHKQNGGVSSARNAGLHVAEGSWVTFVDSDDYVTCTYLEDLYEPDYDLTVISHIHVNCSDESRQKKTIKTFSTAALDGQQLQMLLEENGTYWVMFCWGRLFRHRLLKEHQLLYIDGMNCGEDYIFSSHYLSVCNSLCMKESTSYIHMASSSGTLSTTFDIAFFDNIQKAEETAAGILESRFHVSYPRKSDEEIQFIYAGCLGSIAADQNLSFPEKYAIYRYLYQIPLFRKTLDNTAYFYPGTSNLYRLCLKTKSPLIMLCGLTATLRFKKCL